MAEAEAYSRFFEVKLDLFDGPIDLLLHLVKKRELPIEKVSLAEVTGQYLECIKSLRYYDVEVAAEYLVIAATLLSVKASVLLNDPVELIPDENGELVDPHEELLSRLRELELFRAAAAHLQDRPVLGHDVFAPPPKISKIDPGLIPLANHSSELLSGAFQEVLKRLGERSATFKITLDTVSIVERMRSVVDILKSCGGSTTFAHILSGIHDRISAVGTFVALLELCRRRVLGLKQDGPGAEIEICLVGSEGATTAGPDDESLSTAIEAAAAGASSVEVAA
jgi:segregation and condensation protein A